MNSIINPVTEQNYQKAQKVLGEILDGGFVKNEEQFKAALETTKHYAVLVGHETQRRGQNMRIIERMVSNPEDYRAFAQKSISGLELPEPKKEAKK